MKNSVYLQLALIAGSLVLLVVLVLNQQPAIETPTAIVLRDGDQEIEVVPAADPEGEESESDLEVSPGADNASEAAPAPESASTGESPAPRPRRRPAQQPAAPQADPAALPQDVSGAEPPPDETTLRNMARRQLGLPAETTEPEPETAY